MSYSSCLILLNFTRYTDTTKFLPSDLIVNKEEKYKLLVEQFAETEHRARAAAKEDAFEHLSATKPISSEVARTGRMRRQTITTHFVEKATVGGAASFAPAIIGSTLRATRYSGH